MKTPIDRYDYDLPPERIAQAAAEPRDASKLLVADRAAGTLEHRRFSAVADYIRAGDLLIVNNTRVFPARLFFLKDTGTRIEFLFVRPDDKDEAAWLALARPAKRLRDGMTLVHESAPGVSITVVEKDAGDGACRVRFAPGLTPRNVFAAHGAVPLPPYITAPIADAERYQTIYSETDGSTAAPTAGLHFTPGLLERLRAAGAQTAPVTLHIGYATFRPVRADFIEDHAMHEEWYDVPDETAEAINRTRAAGGRIIAVGTTSVRTLESWAAGGGADGRLPARGGAAWTKLFITEGFRFRAVDALITNFHLPRSTLIVLAAAFCGRDLLMRAYREAIESDYRFYSLGDAMMIL